MIRPPGTFAFLTPLVRASRKALNASERLSEMAHDGSFLLSGLAEGVAFFVLSL